MLQKNNGNCDRIVADNLFLENLEKYRIYLDINHE